MEEERPHTNGSDGSGGPEGGAKIGDVLARAREERGLSLQEVEQATKIRKRYLSGLEREDFSDLPDSVYVQGFLKTYANFLGLDGEELAQDLKRRRGRRRDQRQPGVGEIKKSGFDRPVLGPGGLSQAQGRKVSSATLFTLIAAALVLTAVIGALYFVGRDTQTVVSPQAPPAEQAPPEGDPPEAAGFEGEAGGEAESGAGGSAELASGGGGAAPDDLEVTVSVEGTESWLSVSADGAVAYEQIAPVGFSQTFEAEEDVFLSTGNAGALRVEVNGQDVGDVGDVGEVLNRSFTLKDAS
ncbi:MAG: helix-turn-helix domain-containing protein [Rubrobacter sp.]|nr:helix-turn-helix domain-containing protein [Rubrobacter sp.]